MTSHAGEAADDLGLRVQVPDDVRRVVSIVPSLTEAIAVTAPQLLVGATDWCSQPEGLQVQRIRGTKNPDIERILALRPDLVVANEEENKPADLATLRAAGVAVWVTQVRTLDEALDSLGRMLTIACHLEPPQWLADAERAWAGPDSTSPTRANQSVVIPIWRRPWMVIGRDTFAGDLLARLGYDNAFAAHAERYPRVQLDEIRALVPDLIVLPDEPYAFTAHDGPEAFPGLPAALVSGRHLTWYGPSLGEAPALLSAQLSVAQNR